MLRWTTAHRADSRKGAPGLSENTVLNVGDLAPDFTLRTIGLKEVGLAEFRGKNVVVLFYPLDWTPG